MAVAVFNMGLCLYFYNFVEQNCIVGGVVFVCILLSAWIFEEMNTQETGREDGEGSILTSRGRWNRSQLLVLLRGEATQKCDLSSWGELKGTQVVEGRFLCIFWNFTYDNRG